ncbi:MAG: hypothetical protein RLZZ396_2078, partial [Planctomycetota bacterium]
RSSEPRVHVLQCVRNVQSSKKELNRTIPLRVDIGRYYEYEYEHRKAENEKTYSKPGTAPEFRATNTLKTSPPKQPLDVRVCVGANLPLSYDFGKLSLPSANS